MECNHLPVICIEVFAFSISDAMALDSEAAFQARALEVGISSADLNALKDGAINSYSRFAFCCAYQPGSGNKDVLFSYLEEILTERPSGASASNYRRLFFECHALALKDLQSRLERSDSSEMKILPLAEKVQRLEALKAKFPGVMLSTSWSPVTTSSTGWFISTKKIA